MPPPENINTTNSDTIDKTPSVILKVRLLHRDIYIIGHKLTKRDKLGMHGDIEKACLRLLSLLIEAAFSHKELKLKVIEVARVHTEVLKHLIRTEQELEIIDMKTYLRISNDLVEISKMINGWIGYTMKKHPNLIYNQKIPTSQTT